MLFQLFKDSPTLDFNDCENLSPDHDLVSEDSMSNKREEKAQELSNEDLREENIQSLSPYKFTAVDSITLFVEKSTGGEIVGLSRVVFYGESIHVTNMNKLEKVDEHGHSHGGHSQIVQIHFTVNRFQC